MFIKYFDIVNVFLNAKKHYNKLKAKNMKVLVTGGCGFIGSNFIIGQLKKTNNTLLNLDKLTYAANTKNLTSVEKFKRYSFVKGDICDSSTVSKTLNNFKPEWIIHFAAESHVDRSITNPLKFIQTNLYGTAVLLNESLLYYRNNYKTLKNKFKFLHISTDEVFGALGNQGYFTEETPYNPSSPYSSSKAGSDHLVRAWHRTYNFPTLITNCSNNYGPFQFPEKLIPLIIANCVDEKPLPIYGDGLNVRDWLFVGDHCSAIEKVLTDGKIGETYNIGGKNEIKNIEIVKTICKIMDDLKPRKNSKSYVELIEFVKDRPGHDFRYAINAKKIENELNWQPSENFETGIKRLLNGTC